MVQALWDCNVIGHRPEWNSDFYDLRSFENGLCHTYNPPARSDSDFLSRMYFMISKGYEGEYNRYMLF